MDPRTTACRIATRLRESGHQALLAGGCVRDRLRGVTPTDFDIATSASPDDVRALFPRTVAVGVAFGVVVVLEEGVPFEVATFREDVGVADGRHPAAVRFADAQADARRRDFTVNGLFEDPSTGEVFDFVGGRDDLRARRIRAIGDPRARFVEDRLRMLRAVRLATVLEFRIEPATMAAIREQARAITSVSAERIRDEISAILLSGRGGRGLGLLREAGLLEPVLPEVAALDGVAQPTRYHPEGDALTHTRMMLDGLADRRIEMALAALLHDIGKPPTATVRPEGRILFPNHAPLGARMAVDVMQRLRYPSRVVEGVERLVARHMDWKNLPHMRPARQRRFLLQEDFPLHLELHRLDCEACHRDLAIHAFAEAERERLEAEPPPVRPFVDGHGLQALGYRPGPAFRVMLDALVDAQLEGTVRDAKEAAEFLRRRFAAPHGRAIAGEESG